MHMALVLSPSYLNVKLSCGTHGSSLVSFIFKKVSGVVVHMALVSSPSYFKR